jgi:hypothetical protein
VESLDVQLPPEPEPIAPDFPVDDDADDAIARSLQATFRAEELQRQAQQPPTVGQIIDSLNLSDFKKAFLRQHPEFVTHQPSVRAMSQAYGDAIRAGIADDSEEMNRAILAGVDRIHEAQLEHELAVARLSEAAKPRAEPLGGLRAEPRHTGTFPLAPQCNGHDQPADYGNGGTAPPPIIRKTSMPITAPVSRSVPSASTGTRVSDAKSITLTAEERIIARNSFGPIKSRNGSMVDLSNEQKELLYAQSKAKMLRMKAEGSIP